MKKGKLYKNEHPHWFRVWELSEFIRGITVKVPQAQVDMGKIEVCSRLQHTCGTPACFGGWVAVYALTDDEIYDYSSGAQWVAEFLGYQYEWQLESWAQDNVKIWGNEFGTGMFADSNAYGEEHREPTLDEIADHWLGVAKRLCELQEGIPYDSI